MLYPAHVVGWPCGRALVARSSMTANLYTCCQAHAQLTLVKPSSALSAPVCHPAVNALLYRCVPVSTVSERGRQCRTTWCVGGRRRCVQKPRPANALWASNATRHTMPQARSPLPPLGALHSCLCCSQWRTCMRTMDGDISAEFGGTRRLRACIINTQPARWQPAFQIGAHLAVPGAICSTR